MRKKQFVSKAAKRLASERSKKLTNCGATNTQPSKEGDAEKSEQEGKIDQAPGSFQAALIRLLPDSSYSAVYTMGIVTGIVYYIVTHDTWLLLTFLGVTTGKAFLNGSKDLIETGIKDHKEKQSKF